MVWLLGLVLVAGACGGSASASEGIATIQTDAADPAGADTKEDVAEDVDPEQAMMALAACLREQGLDIDDPTVDADGNVQFGAFRGGGEAGDPPADRDTISAAKDACHEQLGDVVLGFGGRDFDPTEMQDMLVEYAACMRDNGYDMDDPDFSSFGPGSGDNPDEGGKAGPFGQIDRDDPDFIAANEACGELLGGLSRAKGWGAGK